MKPKLPLPRRVAATKRPCKPLEFLNSPLGLWLLSTIFISAASTVYSAWNESEKDRRAKAELVRKLDTEIERRLGMYDINLLGYFLVKLPLDLPLDQPLTEAQAMQLIKKLFGSLSDDEGVFPEYRSRTMLSLLAELSSALEGREQACVRVAMRQLEMLVNRLRVKAAPTNALDIASRNEVLSRIRWSDFARRGEEIRRTPKFFRRSSKVDVEFNKDNLPEENYCGLFYAGRLSQK